VNSREIIKKIRADGWYLVSVEGSHHQFKHPTKSGRTTIPHPKKNIAIGTIIAIEKQSGLKLR
jgi:predicted RNA binding protein YcfA (HicA-like mRNA interferase family)